jgi:hypothetical protein
MVMRRLLARSAVLGLLVALVAVAPVSAKTRVDVTITVETVFGEDPNDFTASGIPDCTWGDTYTVGGAVFGPIFGQFLGYKIFDCEQGGETGFAVRLNAQFSYSGGATGTWTIVDAWGDLAGMSGGGKLLGVPMVGVDGITDYYVGRVTR